MEMESLCTSIPRCVNERCERLDSGRLLSAWGSFCLRVDDPRHHRQRSRPFHDDCGESLQAGAFSLITALYEHPSFFGVFPKGRAQCS
jgi:hypothetical protein